MEKDRVMLKSSAATVRDSATQDRADGRPKRAGMAAIGAGLSAVAASSCCILPLALFSLGVGGAWIGNLTALAPYQPVFVAVAAAFLGYGFYAVYRKPKAACTDGATCGQPLSTRAVKTGLWAALALISAAIVFPFVAPSLLGV
jgi:mercuric ion transport protein